MTSNSFAELWANRELLYFLAWRDIRVRYKQAVLGAAWAILQPLASMIIFTLFFGRLAQMPSNGVDYPLFSFSGLIAWTYFSSTLSQASNSLISNANLITKVYFPRVLLPAASAVGGLLDFAVGAIFLVALMFYYGAHFGPAILLAPLFVLLLIVFSTSVSMLLAALNVRYRDVKYTVPFLIQLGMFVTPIIYPMDFLPSQYRFWFALNPMAGIVEGLRMSLFPGYPFDVSLVWTSCAITAVLLVTAWVYFRKTERVFADVI